MTFLRWLLNDKRRILAVAATAVVTVLVAVVVLVTITLDSIPRDPVKACREALTGFANEFGSSDRSDPEAWAVRVSDWTDGDITGLSPEVVPIGAARIGEVDVTGGKCAADIQIDGMTLDVEAVKVRRDWKARSWAPKGES